MTKACGVSLVRAPIRSGNQGGTAGFRLVPWGRAFVFYGGVRPDWSYDVRAQHAVPLRDGILTVGAYRDTPVLDCSLRWGDDDSYRRRVEKRVAYV